MKKVLVLGGSYFLGRVFVEKLLKEQSFEIYVLNRGSIPIRKEGVHEIVCDRHNPGQMRRLIPTTEWHAVIDFCAYNPEDIIGVMDVLSKDKVEQYIYISTASVYEQTWSFPIKEDDPKLEGPQPELGPFADYGYNKWLAEMKLQERCNLQGLAYTTIRPAFVYGKYNYAPRESYFFELIVKNERIVIPENSLALFSFVSVWDVAKIIIGCLGNVAAYNHAFNASADDLISYKRLLEVFEIIVQRKLEVETMPMRRILELQIPLPFPFDSHLIYSGVQIQSIIDFQYTPFIDGMKETYRYYKIGRGLT